MRVLHVINNLQLAGAETLVRDLATRQRAAGLEVSVFTLQATGSPLEEDLRRAGVPLRSANLSSSRDPRAVLALRREFRQHSPHVVHVHLFPAQLWAAIAVTGLRRAPKLVTTEHNTHNNRRKRLFWLLDAWMYSSYSRIAAISEGTRDALTKWQPSTKRKVIVVPNGIDLEKFTRPPGLLEQPKSMFRVISVGRFEEQKNQALLIRALPNLPGVSVDFVGVGPQLAECQALAASLGVAERIRFLGRRTDIPELLWDADAYVQTSRWEGFGIAALEGMAAGLPTVVSDVPGLADVVADAGLRFPSGDCQGLASALARVTTDNPLREQLLRAAPARASAYSISETVAGYEVIYAGVTGK